MIYTKQDDSELTLLASLVLFLILLEKHIIRQCAARYRALSTHRMALAGQGTRALRAVGESNTTLFFHIDRTLWLGRLLLGLVLLLLFL